MKTCTGCQETLGLAQFSRDRRQKDGLFYRCKACEIARLRAHRDKKYRVAERIEAQGGGCAICGDPVTLRQSAVDHDHRCCPPRSWASHHCGACTRGVLCRACNLGLGHFLDDPARLEAAAAYLRRVV